MDTTRWAQGIGLLKKPMEEELVPSNSNIANNTTNNNHNNIAASSQQAGAVQVGAERKAARPQKEQALHCPRCNSANTKFCYYNNYSLTQPRYFCKTCRRYWTEGGSLRNVPVGGGSRKNKRHSSINPNPNNNNPSTTSSSMPTGSIKNLHNIPTSSLNPITSSSHQHHFDQVQDLNLAFPNHAGFLNSMDGSSSSSIANGGAGGLSAMELLRSTGITAARGLGPLVPMLMHQIPTHAQESGGGLFPFDGNMQDNGGRRLLFPFGELKQEQHRGQGGSEPPMFWNGMMGGGAAGSW